MRSILTSLLIISTLLSFAFATNHNDKGKAIYDKYCQACHNPSTAPLMKSPTVHDQAAWKTRMADAEALAKKDPKHYKNGMDVLIQTVKTGKGAMVPGGMCQDEKTPDKKCTDADYKAAIKYMMSSKK